MNGLKLPTFFIHITLTKQLANIIWSSTRSSDVDKMWLTEGKVGDLMFHVLSNLMRKEYLGVKVIQKAVT